MDSTGVSEALNSGSIPDEATLNVLFIILVSEVQQQINFIF